ncbi:hypothetical protein CPB85DRAFT_1331363 [Mucidula mucida]|nr:hypothetical protein CPB85DRAFT_1331363 [Mucidula mucida]
MGSGYVAMLVQSFLPSIARTPFVERFKYDIISSNLLSTTLSTHTPYPKSPTFPGTIATPSETSFVRRRRSSGGTSGHPKQDEENAEYWVWAVGIVLLCAGYFILGLAACGFAWITSVEAGATEDMQDSIDALKELVCAGDTWDSVVHEALGILEKDVSNPPSANPSSPGITRSRSSTANNTPLRVALQSTLHTTQTACDNIRPLFIALTSPDELRQLSEMYAPPNPQRPVSLPTLTRKTAMEDKRATWGGKRSTWYGTPNGKRRSELTSLLSHSPSRSAPVTPLQEEDESDDPLQDARTHGDVFGLEALDLQRRRRMSSQLSPMSPIFIQPPRLSALQASLSAAISAKRYTAAHLLALRFTDEALQDYWEDVRSVMSLLTGALADAAARLGEAIAEHEQGQEELGRPSRHSREVSRVWAERHRLSDLSPPNLTLDLDLGETEGYAPVPGRMARFGLHVEKLREAMRAAGGELEGAVGALKGHRRVHSDASDSSSAPLLHSETDTTEPHAAIQAYDRLRRELGVALRECERGRACLVEALVPPAPSSSSSRPSSLGSVPSLDHGPVSEESILDHELEVLVSTGIDHPILLPRDDEMELGIEEVYEHDLGLDKPSWTRERSTMSREERIRAAKENRELEREKEKESRKPVEVVEELKDVISRVKEERERRQLGAQYQPTFDEELEEATLAYVDEEEVHAEIGVAL